jgi:8-oxo-dGTP diphosphatase
MFAYEKGRRLSRSYRNVLLSRRKRQLRIEQAGENCRDEQGRWDFGGGGLDVHDTVEDTLRKEIKEEYCAEVLEYEFLGYRDVHRESEEGTKTHWIALDFKVLVDRDSVKNGEPHKFDEINWFTIDSLPQPLHSQIPKYLQTYKDRW